MKLSLWPSAQAVRTNLASHSVIGLTAAALMYVICVSGTIAVFYKALERWEQPTVTEMASAPPTTVQRAGAAAMARTEALSQAKTRPHYLLVTLPTAELPRLSVSAGDVERFVAPDGSLAEPVAHDWTDFLVDLHFSLNLPLEAGLVVVGVLGVMLIALIISGLLAHPNLFRDAFSLRLAGSERVGQVDVHNRLSVWGLPFHLGIALTGALIGLVGVFLWLAATVLHGGDVEATRAPLFGADPEPTGVAAPLADIGAALESVAVTEPDVHPFYVTVHEPATTAQVVAVGAQLPRRLVWAERYRFDADGRSSGRLGWSDGAVGAQVYASTFRLHFGHFGGMPVKLAYVLLGLALCAVTATGLNIWLAKRRQRGAPAPGMERSWTATVWGVPAAITLSALTSITLGLPAAPVFWTVVAGVATGACRYGERHAWSVGLRSVTAALALLVVLGHGARFGSAAVGPAALTINLGWLVLALGMAASVWQGGFGLHRAAPVRAPASSQGG